MAMPDLSLEEKLLLKMIKSREIGKVGPDPALWGQLIGVAVVTLVALKENSLLMMAVALAVFCGFTFYRTWQHNYWDPHCISLIEKLEAGCQNGAVSSDTPQPDSEA